MREIIPSQGGTYNRLYLVLLNLSTIMSSDEESAVLIEQQILMAIVNNKSRAKNAALRISDLESKIEIMVRAAGKADEHLHLANEQFKNAQEASVLIRESADKQCAKMNEEIEESNALAKKAETSSSKLADDHNLDINEVVARLAVIHKKKCDLDHKIRGLQILNQSAHIMSGSGLVS